MQDYLDCYIRGIRRVLDWTELELLKQQEMREWGNRERPTPMWSEYWRRQWETWYRDREFERLHGDTRTFCDMAEQWSWLLELEEEDPIPDLKTYELVTDAPAHRALSRLV